jgi:small-conductance mechanosensitive channel
MLAQSPSPSPIEEASTWVSEWWPAAAWVAAALLVTLVMRIWVRRTRRKAEAAADDQVEGGRLRRASTVVGLVAGTIQVLAWVVAITVILATAGMPLGPVFASAGVVGVALGFGAQTVVKDTLSGFFIALEGQFDVGDFVELQTDGGPVSGTIEGLSLRTTSIRQFDGPLATVPNGAIQITSNKTRGWGRAIVDIRVALDEDPGRVREVLEEVVAAAAEQEPLAGWLREPPKVLGVTQLTEIAQVIRVVAETLPNHRSEAERELRARMAQGISARGIRVPPLVAPPPPGA